MKRCANARLVIMSLGPTFDLSREKPDIPANLLGEGIDIGYSSEQNYTIASKPPL